MSEAIDPLRKSLDSIDRYRRRITILGWIVAAATLGMYFRLAYLHRTTDNLERLLSASVTSLTFLIAWVGFAIVLTVTRAARQILRAIDLATKERSK